MKKVKRNLCMVTLAAAAVALTSCGNTRFAVTSGGENLSALTKVTDSEDPCITPFGGDDGKNLLYAQGEKKGAYYNIYKKEDAYAVASVQKTSGRNINYSPAYCAATDDIAFRCQSEGMAASDIFIVDGSKGKALRRITESSNEYEGNPDFSKDGRYLVYDKQSYEVKKAKSLNFFSALFGFGGVNTVVVENSEIWLKDLKSGQTVLLGPGYQPSFSPNGKEIAYVKYSTDAKSTSIYIMSVDGNRQVQVTDAKKGYAFNPRWSPDGKRLIFQSARKDKKDYDIYVVGIDGEGLTQLTVNKSSDLTPYWTRDGYIYFASDRGGKKGNYQIWRFKFE